MVATTLDPLELTSLRATPARMTRCECSGVSFAELAARIDEGEHLDEAARATGCGQTCTACWPDLEHYLRTTRR